MGKSTILYYFEEISKIPRGSFHEEKISDYLLDFAKEHGLWAHRDEKNNVYIKKDASQGKEAIAPVLLQGHMDMVCEKNEGVEHDFLHDPIRLYEEDGMLRARGTTLGADNGVAVAYMLAFLADEALSHPPLECLFTVQEEVGLLGAGGVVPSLLSSRRMINMDFTQENVVTVSCAGGMVAELSCPGSRTPAQGDCISGSISGLFGGHSGMDAQKQRGNSNQIAGRLMDALSQNMAVNLVSLLGGDKDNAIPRENRFSCCVPAGKGTEAIAFLEEEAGRIRAELQFDDPGFVFSASGASLPAEMFDGESTNRMLSMLYLVPNGIMVWSTQTNIPACSLSMGKAETTAEGLRSLHCLRSSMTSLKRDLGRKIEAFAALCGAQCTFSGEYPAWEYQKDSPFRDAYCKTYESIHGEAPVLEATHGGLECGILSGKIPGLEIVATGPNCYHPHTPDEALDLASFEREYQTIRAFLESLQ